MAGYGLFRLALSFKKSSQNPRSVELEKESMINYFLLLSFDNLLNLHAPKGRYRSTLDLFT